MSHTVNYIIYYNKLFYYYMYYQCEKTPSLINIKKTKSIFQMSTGGRGYTLNHCLSDIFVKDTIICPIKIVRVHQSSY